MAEKQVEVIAREFVKALRSRNIRVEKAILFGSYAAGKRPRIATSTSP